MQIPILSGIVADARGDWRQTLPTNMVPVPMATGVSQGYLRPADGIQYLTTGAGPDRGGICWRGQCYRVSGAKLVRVEASGAVQVLGDVGAGGPVRLDYGFDRLIIASDGALYYWDGNTLSRVTDPDLGTVVDACWIGGYTLATDGAHLVVTELGDPAAVNPLKYGSAESDPDPLLAVARLRTEAYAFGRYTIEAFQNVGGEGFPFQRIEGAQVQRGVVGTHAVCGFADTFAFLGSGRNESPGVYLMTPGGSLPLHTREVGRLLLAYSEEELAGAVLESRSDLAHQWLLVHLPDQTLVYDLAASKATGQALWHRLCSSVTGQGIYRARGIVWAHDRWIVGDPASAAIGVLTQDTMAHFGAPVGWEFGTAALYNDGQGAILHELELVALPGRVAFGAQPVVWSSYSADGETWSMERPTRAGAAGERDQRIVWRRCGRMGAWRVQRFRGTSDARLTVARLEARVEPLSTRPGRG